MDKGKLRDLYDIEKTAQPLTRSLKRMDFSYQLQTLQRLIQFDTSNPPGNEEEAILFIASILEESDIEVSIFSPVSKRANLLARIKGKRPERPFVLLSHIDTVPARLDEWTFDPFAGDIHDGFLYGRGTIDMKAQLVCQLFALMGLKGEGIIPEMDVIFLATCDEEVGGGLGVEYMLQKVESLRGASFVLSEGGNIIEDAGHLHAEVSIDEKRLSQFMISAKGTGGHGSMPHKDNPNEKIIDAAKAIVDYKWPIRPTPIVARYLDGLMKGKRIGKHIYKGLRGAIKDPEFITFIEEQPVYNALLRNTVALTILRGGEKVNVIPSEAEAYFDARLLPGEDKAKFFKKIKRLAGEAVELRQLTGPSDEPQRSLRYSYNTGYFRCIRDTIRKRKGEIPVLPYISTGATDLRYFRNLGIPAYGLFPATLERSELLRMHGKDERISIKGFKEGLDGTYELLKAMVCSLSL